MQVHVYVLYMKIHVPSMSIGVDKHTQQTNKQAATMASLKLEQPLWKNNQPQWLRKIIISPHGLENKQPQWLRK